MTKTILYVPKRKDDKRLVVLRKMIEWLDLDYNIIVANPDEGSRGKRAKIFYVDDVLDAIEKLEEE